MDCILIKDDNTLEGGADKEIMLHLGINMKIFYKSIILFWIILLFFHVIL